MFILENQFIRNLFLIKLIIYFPQEACKLNSFNLIIKFPNQNDINFFFLKKIPTHFFFSIFHVPILNPKNWKSHSLYLRVCVIKLNTNFLALERTERFCVLDYSDKNGKSSSTKKIMALRFWIIMNYGNLDRSILDIIMGPE